MNYVCENCGKSLKRDPFTARWFSGWEQFICSANEGGNHYAKRVDE